MLPIPDPTGNIACIVGIDPGTETLGIAVIYFNVDTWEITHCKAQTYKGSKLPGSDWTEAIHGARYRRIEAHTRNLRQILEEENPLVVGSESPFANFLRPGAYGALVEIVCGIRTAVHQWDSYKPLRLIPPSSVKNAVGAKGNATKDPVKDAVLKIAALQTCIPPVSELDEHSVDALAVAYSVYIALSKSEIEPLNELK